MPEYKLDKLLAEHEWVRVRVWDPAQSYWDEARAGAKIDWTMHHRFGHRSNTKWWAEAATIEHWMPHPQHVSNDNWDSDSAKGMWVCRNAAGRPIKIEAPGWGANPPVDGLSKQIEKHSPQGTAKRAEASAVAAQRRQEVNEAFDRHQRLAEDANFALIELGLPMVQPNRTSPNVSIALEDLLTLLRMAGRNQ